MSEQIPREHKYQVGDVVILSHKSYVMGLSRDSDGVPMYHLKIGGHYYEQSLLLLVPGSDPDDALEEDDE